MPPLSYWHDSRYVGSGVASSNVAGRTMADLITRWLGVHAVTTMAKLADRRDERSR